MLVLFLLYSACIFFSDKVVHHHPAVTDVQLPDLLRRHGAPVRGPHRGGAGPAQDQGRTAGRSQVPQPRQRTSTDTRGLTSS